MNNILFLLITVASLTCPLQDVYVGKSLVWFVFFDPNRNNPVVEIGGIKFGYHDYMSDHNHDSKSKIYKDGNKYIYINEELHIKMQLRKVVYNNSIDLKRLNIFNIKTFNQVQELKNKDKKDYDFDWSSESEYIYYRDHCDLPDTYPHDFIENIKKRAN